MHLKTSPSVLRHFHYLHLAIWFISTWNYIILDYAEAEEETTCWISKYFDFRRLLKLFTPTFALVKRWVGKPHSHCYHSTSTWPCLHNFWLFYAAVLTKLNKNLKSFQIVYHWFFVYCKSMHLCYFKYFS